MHTFKRILLATCAFGAAVPAFAQDAAQAGAQPCRARRAAIGKETHIAARRMARRATGAAINSCRQHAGYKMSIKRAITPKNRRPCGVIIHHKAISCAIRPMVIHAHIARRVPELAIKASAAFPPPTSMHHRASAPRHSCDRER